MRVVKEITRLAVIALLAVTLIGVPGAPAAEDQQSVVEQVIRRGVLRVVVFQNDGDQPSVAVATLSLIGRTEQMDRLANPIQ